MLINTLNDMLDVATLPQRRIKMRTFILVAAIFYSVAAITDLNCTKAGVYTKTATACSNKFADAACDAVYHGTTVTAGGSEERPAACFEGTNGPDENVKQLAVTNCAKTCGYCCESADYNCENAKLTRINCASVPPCMCDDVAWRDILAADCPSACGFCQSGTIVEKIEISHSNLEGCIDAAPDCGINPSICDTVGMESFVATNCKRTCGLCDSVTTTTGTVAETTCTGLYDNPSCPSWVAKGFCTNTFYTASQKKENCPIACKLC